MGVDKSLAPTRQQVIIWTNDGKFTDSYMGHPALWLKCFVVRYNTTTTKQNIS